MRRDLLPLVLAALSAAGCASVPTRTIGGAGCRGKLLIATMNTEFKNAVVSEVTRTLSADRVCIRIIDVDDIGSTATGSFAAVVIINDYQFMRMDSDARRFVERMDPREKKKLVLLTTAGSPGRVDEVPEVDAISAASKPADAAAVARKIVDKVRPLLSTK